MNIVSIVRRIGAIPGLQQRTLSTLARCAALLEGLDRDRDGRRRKRRHRKPAPPKD